MGLKNFFKKEYVIGLDIGSSSIKIAQFKEEEGAGLYLLKADLKELNPNAGDEAREKEALSVLRQLFRGIDTKKSHIISTMNCSHAAIKKVTTPYMPKSELREGISLEAKNYFPFPVDGSSLDFEVLGDIVEKGVRKHEVLVGVCPLPIVNTYLTLLGKAGIKPASFVTSSYALQRLAAGMASPSGDIQCFIDIGAVNTELIIYRGRSLVFSRKIPVCGNDFTRAMTSALISDKGRVQLTLEEAEKLKRDVGMPSSNDTRVIDNKIPAQQILAMLRTPAEHLVNEIDRCFDYYREEAGSGKIKSVTIFGGGASLAGLIKFLSDELGMEVKLGDPVEGLKAAKGAVAEREKISHRLDMAIGAALGGSKGINLLPPEIKEEKKRVFKRGTLVAIATVAVIVPLLFYIGIKIKIGNFNKRIAVAKLELSSIQHEVRKAEAKKIASMVLADEPYWDDIFKELGSIIPDQIHVNNIRMENNLITIKGIIASQDGQQIMANFIMELEKGLFHGVKLVESRDLPAGAGIEFELKCWLDTIYDK